MQAYVPPAPSSPLARTASQQLVDRLRARARIEKFPAYPVCTELYCGNYKWAITVNTK